MDEIVFTIKKVELKNLERFNEIIEKCFRLKVDANYYDWKYLKNPFGELVAFEAVHEKNIAAFFGVIPQKFKINGKIVSIFQSMDTMTHPSYQKRGLFVKLANETFAYLKQNQLPEYLIGVPGGNSLHGFVHKLQWKAIHYFSFVFLNKTIFFLRNLLRTSKYSVRQLNGAEPELKDFFANLADSDLPIVPYMDEAFFAWRVFQHPYRKFVVHGAFSGTRLDALSVYEQDQKGRAYLFYIAFRKSTPNKEALYSLLKEIFAKEKSSYIYTWESMSADKSKLFCSMGFLRNPFSQGPFSYKIPFIVRAPQETFDGVSWFTIKNFDFQPLNQD